MIRNYTIFGKGPVGVLFLVTYSLNVSSHRLNGSFTMSTTAYYTEEGFRKLQEELHRLRTVDRPHISHQIAEARDKGDLSENAEYHAAKEDQGLLEARIAKMEEVLASARVFDPEQVENDKVYIHSTVKVKPSEND